MEETRAKGIPLHTRVLMRRTWANRVFAFVYLCVILALLYHHLIDVLHSTSMVPLFLLLADAVLAFMWATSQAFRMSPTERWVFIEHLQHYVKQSDYPGLDVFICTADPYKEPPMCVVNTALSVMAYDYPMEKLSVYVSDDGGSQLTLFAFMEAARFATHWLPYCRKNKILERCPEAYFRSSPSWSPETAQIKVMYESMRGRVENVVKRGSILPDYITNEAESEAVSRWDDGFTPRDHPPVVQVLLEADRDKDITGHTMPNLVYASREKNMNLPHHFKAGALNVLMFYGINKNDTYGAESRQSEIVLTGMDGLVGPTYIGTGCFFRRQVFLGGSSPQLNPDLLASKSIKSKEVLALAHHVAGCNYEYQTSWGSRMGFRYGSLVEDFYTGYRLHCEGWKSIFCNPKRPAFLGKAPINLNDMLNQTVRWCVGLLEVAFCKHSPITFGARSINLLTGLCYGHMAFWPISSIPIAIYAFLPQLALLRGASIFPKASDPWFFLRIFLFLGAYGQNCLEFMLSGGSIRKWWNDQRVWMMRGLSSMMFGLVEYLLKTIGISTFGFSVTNKSVEEEQRKRYDQGLFEFGVSSPLLLPMTTAAIINFISFLWAIAQVFTQGRLEGVLLRMFLAGFATVNCWPIYEAILLRTDGGKIPLKLTLISIMLAWALNIFYCILRYGNPINFLMVCSTSSVVESRRDTSFLLDSSLHFSYEREKRVPQSTWISTWLRQPN